MKSSPAARCRRRVFPWLVLLALSLVSTRAVAGEASVLFVLDLSGSMWGQIEETPKIEIAREAMRDVLVDLPGYVDVGLAAYGHRSKEDCEDIEVVAPLGQQTAIELSSSLDLLSPKGQTPLARALLAAFDEVAMRRGSVYVVLISDGEETCGGDPCAMLSQLRAAGSRVHYHVIGFDVNETEGEQLRCIADAGRGEYHPASDLESLSRALSSVRRKVLEQLPQ